MKLATLLQRNNNNLDVFRTLAACMVIYGHSYALSPKIGESDFVRQLIEFDYSGSLAVKIFFFLSGLVVTNSLLAKKNPYEFIISRAFRLWPALIVTVLITALLIGPAMSSLSMGDYFESSSVFKYIVNNIFLKTTYTLPGVFEGNPYPVAVNGSLWTIPYEAYSYLLLVTFFVLGAAKYKFVSLIIFSIFVVVPLLPSTMVSALFATDSESRMLAPCFAYGVIFAIFKDYINITIRMILGGWVLYFLLRHSLLEQYALYSALFVSILYLSSLKLILPLKMKSDISYGIYLWGFPTQQVLAAYLAEKSLLLNQILSIIISCLLGYVSWVLIEKRSIQLGAALCKKIIIQPGVVLR